jgi:hypothetical protein
MHEVCHRSPHAQTHKLLACFLGSFTSTLLTKPVEEDRLRRKRRRRRRRRRRRNGMWIVFQTISFCAQVMKPTALAQGH